MSIQDNVYESLHLHTFEIIEHQQFILVHSSFAFV